MNRLLPGGYASFNEKKRRKHGRRAALTALVLVLALCFTACSPAEKTALDPENPEIITIWHYYTGAQQETLDRMVLEFNETVGAKKGIIVEAYSQGSINNLNQELLQAARKKVGAQAMPDLFAAYIDTAEAVHNLLPLVDLDEYFTEKERARYVESYLDEGRFTEDKGLYVFPVAKSTEVLIMNDTAWKPFAEETGFTYDDLKTWEGLAETAQAYYEYTDRKTPEPGDGKAFYGRDALANYLLVGSKQLGHEIVFGEEQVNVDKKTLRRLWDNYYIPFVKGYYFSHGRFSSDDAKTGDILALVGSTSGTVYFPDEVYEGEKAQSIEAVVLPLPNFEGTGPCCVQQGAGFCVPESSDGKEEAAVVFLKWFTDSSNNIPFTVQSGYTPVKKESFSEERIREYLSEEKLEIAPKVAEGIYVALRQLEQSEKYTSMPAKNGFKIRQELENSFEEKAVADREAVLMSIKQGKTPEEAVKPFLTNENFEAYYKTLSEKLKAIQ